ncbi:MAG: hypothetical protein Ct9H300mP26_2660 [Acidimicrobiales bacterium]|nr:MAG: hypothetical protein Ct9H300mP26_2660 [Acidimicrobiales bacterium]
MPKNPMSRNVFRFSGPAEGWKRLNQASSQLGATSSPHLNISSSSFGHGVTPSHLLDGAVQERPKNRCRDDLRADQESRQSQRADACPKSLIFVGACKGMLPWSGSSSTARFGSSYLDLEWFKQAANWLTGVNMAPAKREKDQADHCDRLIGLHQSFFGYASSFETVYSQNNVGNWIVRRSF